jgi:chemotaxis protein CheZ
MRMQRKLFRIERMFPDSREKSSSAMNARTAAHASPASTASGRIPPSKMPEEPAMQELGRELDEIYAMIAHSKRELASFYEHSGDGPRVTRATSALGAAIDGMEKSTQQILKAAETIDEGARALHASLKNDYNRGLAQDIADHVVRIYEACNYQDLAGQHISKAMETLKFVEQHVDKMIALWGDVDTERVPAPMQNLPTGRALANGPMIAGDEGHIDQIKVDSLFDRF